MYSIFSINRTASVTQIAVMSRWGLHTKNLSISREARKEPGYHSVLER